MTTSFEQIILSVRQGLPTTLAVAAASDADVLRAVRNAANLGFARAILVGDEQSIRTIAERNDISLNGFSIVHETDSAEMCRKAVGLVSAGNAQVVMKGLVDTSIILKAILDRESGLRDTEVLSHVAVFEVPGFDRLIYVTDAAMNIAPDLFTKKCIIQNCLRVALALGNERPIVACLCAVEKVNPKMPATLDAAELVRMNQSGELPGCVVVGPLALDNAVSTVAAHHKGITHPAAGKADILLVPQIESGNILYKSLAFMANAKNAGVIVGAKAPVVVTSRADSMEAKLNSIALAMRMANYTGGVL